MKLLICTQTVDNTHPILGFFHRWVEEFAKHCEEVHVICLKEGPHQLPDNVFVYSLGKEAGGGRLAYLGRFYRCVWQLRHRYDNVFVHMNPEYTVLAGLFWRLTKKDISQWYSHRSVTWWLRIASVFTNRIFSTTPHAVRLQSNKVIFTGHGIDVDSFTLQPVAPAPTRILYIGRITPIKRIDLMLQVFASLAKTHPDTHFDLIGDIGIPSDQDYKNQLLSSLPDSLKDRVNFLGSKPPTELPAFLAKSHVLYNFSPAGGMDKTVLEAMASGAVPVVTNPAFKDVLGEKSFLCAETEAVETLVALTDRALTESKNETTRTYLRQQVATHAALPGLISKICSSYR